MSKNNNGRDEKGRFAKGNPGGPGNPYSRQVANLRGALVGAVTEDDFKAIAEKLVERAKSGDVPATKLLLIYTIGKPEDPINQDDLDSRQTEAEASRRLLESCGIDPDSFV